MSDQLKHIKIRFLITMLAGLLMQGCLGVSGAPASSSLAVKSKAALMTSFVLNGQASSSINGLTIAVAMPAGSSLTSLVATFAVSDRATVVVQGVAQVSGTTANNFTNSVVYVVTSEDSTVTTSYTVTVTIGAAAAASLKTLNSFLFNGVTGVISESAKTAVVTLPFWNTTGNVSASAATYTFTGASASPVTGTVRNFNTAQTYTITAADNSTQVYTASVIVPTPVWTTVNPLLATRQDYTLNLLNSGNVLVAGGSLTGAVALNTAEVFTATTGVWTTTANVMDALRSNHTATLLANGDVLVAGGRNSTGPALLGDVLYVVATNSWSAAGTMGLTRQSSAAVRLNNNNVLVLGGCSDAANPCTTAITTSQVYSPGAAGILGTWAAGGALNTARIWPVATILADGRVLVSGGTTNATPTPIASTEIFSAAGTAAATAGPVMSTSRVYHSAVVLPNGNVLICGGLNTATAATATCDLFNPTTSAIAATGAMATARQSFALTMLQNGKALACGGTIGAAVPLTSCETYDPTTGLWTATTAMINGRYEFSQVQLGDGRILSPGGISTGTITTSTVEVLR